MTTHLLALWNPSFGANSIGDHIDLLLRRIHDGKEGDDCYVWWGKLRSPRRLQPMPHLADILAVGERAAAGEETHLYLTDFRSLYVAHVGEITTDDPRRDDPDSVPAYYKRGDQKLGADCWFLLWDIRRLVADDTVAVDTALRKLLNLRYHESPVSMYGGMVELPLLVRHVDEVRYFDETTEGEVLAGKRWVQWDAERAGTGAMERELRLNVLGPTVWEGLDPATRTFLATAEGLLRAHREDAAFDFSAVLVDFAKGVEVEASRMVRGAMAGAPTPIRIVSVDNSPRDLATDRLSLGQMSRVIGGDKARFDHFAARYGSFFVTTLPPVLDQLARARNPASHSSRVGAKEVVRWRDRILGIGQHGILDEMAVCWGRK